MSFALFRRCYLTWGKTSSPALSPSLMDLAARAAVYCHRFGSQRTKAERLKLIEITKQEVLRLGETAPVHLNRPFEIDTLNTLPVCVESGARFNAKTSRTVLQLAVCTGEHELVELMLKAGAAPDGVNPAVDQRAALTGTGEGITPLNLMAQYLTASYPMVVSAGLLESTHETVYETGEALTGYTKIAQELLKAGASIDLAKGVWRDMSDWTSGWQKNAIKGVYAGHASIGHLLTSFNRLGLPVKSDISVSVGVDVQGYPRLAQHVQSLKNQLSVDALRSQSAIGRSNNLLLVGNFGVGKRTAVSLLAKVLHEAKRITSSSVLVRRGADILNTYWRPETDIHSLQSIARLPSGFSGILFIEEAAKMLLQEGDLKTNVIDALLTASEANPDVTLALGVYPAHLNRLKQAIPGLVSRFPFRFDMPDFSPDDIASMLRQTVKQRGLLLAPEVDLSLIPLIRQWMANTDARDGNAHTVNNMLGAALQRQATRLSKQAAGGTEATLLTLDDFASNTMQEMDEDAILKQLDEFAGLDRVKQFVRSLYCTAVIERARVSAGFTPQKQEALHMIFKGNPGTGKTSFAKIIAQLFRKMGLVSRGQLIEAKRADLVASYLGQTAAKTSEVVQSARGGILFIDEAYGLVNDKQDPYGEEALTTLLEAMETHRADLVVILAGYTNEMESLIKKNPGLPSRFPHQVVFADFTTDELQTITHRMLTSRNVSCRDHEAKMALNKLVTDQKIWLQQGNARSARNLVDNLMRQQGARLLKDDPQGLKASAQQLREITCADIAATEQVFNEANKSKADLRKFII